jgi:hypothetical protein
MAGRFGNTFGEANALIGVIHLLPLPGSPRFGGDMAGVTRRAVEESELLHGNGFDGVIVENYGDLPFTRGRVGAVTVAAMAAVTSEITRTSPIPVGVNVLRNDAESAVAIAAACGCRFVRVNILVGSFVTTEGLIQGDPGRVMRVRQELAPDLLVLADVMVKHAHPLGPASIGDHAVDTVRRGGADGIIVTGPRTGEPVEIAELEKARSALGSAAGQAAVLVGSGVTPANVAALAARCDGIIVGSYLRENGIAGEAMDGGRVRKIAELAGKAGN